MRIVVRLQKVIHWKRFRIKRDRKQSVMADWWLVSKFYLHKYKIMSIVMHKYQPSSVLLHLPPLSPAWVIECPGIPSLTISHQAEHLNTQN